MVAGMISCRDASEDMFYGGEKGGQRETERC